MLNLIKCLKYKVVELIEIVKETILVETSSREV